MKLIDSKDIRIGILAFCALALSAGPATAQQTSAPSPTSPAGAQASGPGAWGGHHDPAQMEARQLDSLTKHLNLTPDQVSQVKSIEDAQRTQMMALRDDTSISREDKHSKMMAMRQDRQSKIRAVLTDEQKPKYDAMLAKERERMQNHERGQGEPPSTPPAAQ